MTIMNHSNSITTTISNNNKMNKLTSGTQNKLLNNNYIFNNNNNNNNTQTTTTTTIPNNSSSSYRIIKNPYSSSTITFENKRALFNGNNSSSSNNYFQPIEDSTTNNNNKLNHSNSVESLINNNNTTDSSSSNSNRKSAFQALKPRSNTLQTSSNIIDYNNCIQQQQYHMPTNSNNSLNMMNNLQQNNREFSEKLYAYKTKIANTVAPTPSITTAPINHHTRYSYSSKSKLNQFDSFDNNNTISSSSTANIMHKTTPPSVNDLLFINNINFDTKQNIVKIKPNEYTLTHVYNNDENNNKDDENHDLSSSLTNFEQKLANTTIQINNTLPFTNPAAATSSSSSTSNINNPLLMNSFQFFSHFDVQSILFDYNDIKLKKDSLHTSLNIRTGASAASRQGSMENLTKISTTTPTTVPQEQNYLTRVNNQYFNGNGIKNETISLQSSSPRQSLNSNTPSSSSSSSTSSSNVVASTTNHDVSSSIKILLSNDSSSLISTSELVENCPCFKIEIGGDLFKGLGLARESQRRFMKLNTVSLLDKVTNYKKDLSDSIETNYNEPFAIEFQDYGAHFYRYYFFNQDHVNYLGIDKDIGPVSISIKRDKIVFIDNNQHQSEHVYRFIMRTSELYTLRGTISEEHIPSKQSSNSKGVSHKDIINYLTPQLEINCLKVADSKANEKLLQLDESHINKTHKIGVLLCKSGQSSEEEMYNNKDSTPAFDEFLSLIGEKINLKGLTSYKGGLDTKTDTTGIHSIHTRFRDREIMFHVSTLLPFTINDKQQLTRKRHIGNDVVTIIFQEPGSLPFSPKSIRSHFQHIFIIVRVYNPNTTNTYYSVAVSYSKDIPSFGPPLPKNPRFIKGQEFREFILSKIINADNAGLKCEKFTQMRMRARNGVLKDLALNYTTKTNLDSNHRFGIFNFGSIKQKKLRSKSLQIFSSNETMQLSGGIFWPVDIEDYKYAFNCQFGISKQYVVAVDMTRKSTIFTLPCNSVIGWSVNEDEFSFVLYFDQGEYIHSHTKSKVDLQQILKRLEHFTRGSRANEITIERKENSNLGFNINNDSVLTEVELYSIAYHRGLRKGTKILKISESYTCLLSHDKIIDMLRKSLFLKLIVLPPFDDGTPRRGQEDYFSLYSYLSTCSSAFAYNERPIDTIGNTNNSQPTVVNQSQSNNKNNKTPNTHAYTNTVYATYGYDNYPSSSSSSNNNNKRITMTINPQNQQNFNLTNSTNNLNILTSNLNNTSKEITFKNSSTSMNRNNNNNNELTNESSDIYQSATLSPFSKQQQHNVNLEWTKLIQTATKAFENAHRSSDNLYYSDLLNDQPPLVPPPPPPPTTAVKIPQNSVYSDAIVELKDNYLRIKLELDQEKIEKQNFKSKISFLIDENSSLKQELKKLKDENKILNRKFSEFLSSTATNASFSILNHSNSTNI